MPVSSTLRLLLLCLSTVSVLAQYDYGGGGNSGSSSTSSAAGSAPSAPADTPGHLNVDVNFNGDFVYHPANLTAPVGTLVTFWFPNSQFSHSVTQSSFANPCTYLVANGSNPAGFDSGLTTGQQFTINITDTQPIWFHCKQVTHCGLGMVGSINAPADGDNTHDKFVAAAKQVGTSLPAESDSGPVTGGLHGVATAPPSAASSPSPSAAYILLAPSIRYGILGIFIILAGEYL